MLSKLLWRKYVIDLDEDEATHVKINRSDREFDDRQKGITKMFCNQFMNITNEIVAITQALTPAPPSARGETGRSSSP